MVALLKMLWAYSIQFPMSGSFTDQGTPVSISAHLSPGRSFWDSSPTLLPSPLRIRWAQVTCGHESERTWKCQGGAQSNPRDSPGVLSEGWILPPLHLFVSDYAGSTRSLWEMWKMQGSKNAPFFFFFLRALLSQAYDPKSRLPARSGP